MGVSKESVSNLLIGNRFHVKLRIICTENCKQSLRVSALKPKGSLGNEHCIVKR